MGKRQLSVDKETENWRRYQRDTTSHIIRKTELYCKFALAKETEKLILMAALFREEQRRGKSAFQDYEMSFALAKEILEKFGIGQRDTNTKFCGGKRDFGRKVALAKETRR